MRERSFLLALAVFLILGSSVRLLAAGPAEHDSSSVMAATPPMGWNSWDGYGTTVKESDVKANAQWLAKHLKSFGWQYVVVDMEWFVTNPTPEGNSKTSDYSLDDSGRYTPAVNRFPSAANGAGFKPLADYVHSLGLKFGIHILRGIPKLAVEKNLPIAGSSFHATDAADSSDTCPWNFDNYGIDGSKPGAQAYYDSIAKLYASWEVDLIKVDCISSRPYKGDEIRMLSTALASAGRPIVLSLSPGPAPLEKTEEMRNTLRCGAFRTISGTCGTARWIIRRAWETNSRTLRSGRESAVPGHWPDADMLPLGYLGPAPGWGQPRYTRLTHDEQRTFVTLWCIFPSPLMVGGDLPKADAWTTSLLTNPEVIAVDQHSTGNHPVISTDKTVVWVADSARLAAGIWRSSTWTTPVRTSSIHGKTWAFPMAKHKVRDLWKRKNLASAKIRERHPAAAWQCAVRSALGRTFLAEPNFK